MRTTAILLVFALFIASFVHAQVTFVESASQLNMGEEDFSAGVAIVDIDNDYVNEVFIVNRHNSNRFYVRQESTYINMAQHYGVTYSNMFHNITAADVNFDYLPDFYLTGSETGYVAKLFVNNAPAPFVDMAEAYNLRLSTDMSAAFFQMTPTSGLCILAGRRLMMMQHGTFVDITQGSGLEGLSNVLTPVFFDLDGDIDDDLFIAGNWELNVGALYRNNGDGTFTDISTNTNEGGFGYGQEVTFGDIDNDGDFDIYLCSGFGTNSMWKNDGSGYFTNITDLSNTGCGGYSRGANFADFDNDGDLDLFVNRASARKMLYLNIDEGIFADFSEEAGVVDTAGGFGCAIGDLDGDGQMDIIAANSDYVRKQVYINQNSNASFLKVKLNGRSPNTLALGAIIELYGDAGPTAGRELIGKREISSHPSFYCVNDLVAHFGTGDHTELEVVVYFQSLAVKDTFGVVPGEMIILEEPLETSADESGVPLPLRHITLSAYPNPFNSFSVISINGGNSEKYFLAIYDMLGRQIRSAEIPITPAGYVTYTWDGKNYQGCSLPSGVYFVYVQAENTSSELKITLLK
jgi:hypothetical protein